MSASYPDKAYRVLRLDDKDRNKKSVLIGLHHSEDGFTQFSVSSCGVGQPAFLTPCVSLRALDLQSEIAINEELERAVCQMELNGYDLVSDVDTVVQELPELLANAEMPAWVTADNYFRQNESSIEDGLLVEVIGGLRTWVVIDEGVAFLDAKTQKSISPMISQHTLNGIAKSFANDALGRTVLEAFVSDGNVLITDALKINGVDVSDKDYTAVVRQLEKTIPSSSSSSAVSDVRIAQPIRSIEHSVRVLADSDSALRPVLYAKHNRKESTLIDRYRGVQVQFTQSKNGYSDLNYIDFEFTAKDTQLPIAQFPSFDNEYTAVGVRPGTDRMPVLF